MATSHGEKLPVRQPVLHAAPARHRLQPTQLPPRPRGSPQAPGRPPRVRPIRRSQSLIRTIGFVPQAPYARPIPRTRTAPPRSTGSRRPRPAQPASRARSPSRSSPPRSPAILPAASATTGPTRVPADDLTDHHTSPGPPTATSPASNWVCALPSGNSPAVTPASRQPCTPPGGCNK